VSSKALSSTPSGAIAGQSMTVASATLTIKKDAGAPTTKIVLSGQNGVELNKINLEATNENLVLKKISLIFASASTSPTGTEWSATSSTGIPAKVSKLYLYDGSTLLNDGGTSLVSGIATISGLNVSLTQDQAKVLTVKADLASSNNVANSIVGAAQVYCSVSSSCTSQNDLEVYKDSGLMTSGVTLTSSSTGNYMLFTDAAPAISNAYTSGSGTRGSAEIIGKYTVTNPGSRLLTVTDLRMKVTMTGASGTTGSIDGYVQTFDLYDEAGSTKLATSTIYTGSGFSGDTSSSVNASSSIVYLDFDPVTYGAADQEVAANGGTRTFVIKADTTYVDKGLLPTSQRPTIHTEVSGDRGYLSSDVLGPDEIYWNDSYVTYTYTPVGGNAITGNKASDSVPVAGAKLTY
jgi:hypothetical protein